MLHDYDLKIFFCLFFILIIFISCDQPVEKPTKPQLVRKKIVAKVEKKKTAKKSVKKVASKPKDTYKPKSDISKIESTKKVSKPLDISKKTKKRDLRPKSVISKTPKDMTKKMVVAKKEKKVAADKKPAIDKKTIKPTKEKKQQPTKTTPPKVSKSLLKISKTTPYNPQGKIDPFQPLFLDKPILAVKKKRKRRTPRTPLEKIALSQLRLVAIIRAPSGNKACVEESSGKGYIIKRGDFIGLNSGKVIKILKDNIVIEEEIEDHLGELQTRQKEIKLPKPAGE